MASSRKIVQIFLGSPGDLKEERQAAKAVVDRFNKEWGPYFGIHVELVGWEETVSRYGRPQELINRDLDRCEAFIGVMWKHWGSPPSTDGSYTSGFEEEFARSVESQKRVGKPEISLFFKDIDAELLKDPGEGLKRVIAFKERIISEKEILFETFATTREFEDRIRGCITNYVQRLQADEEQQASSEVTARSSDDSAADQPSPAVQPYTPLSTEGAKFVREFVAKSERDRATHPILSVEVARFRLLGTMLGVTGNDENSLGVHDANIIFTYRDELSLGTREMRGLVDSGLDHIANEVVPIWHWYKAMGGAEDGYLSLATLIGSQSQRVGALSAMRLVGEPVKPLEPLGSTDGGIGREQFVQSWLSSSNDRVRAAALEYLAVCGDGSDLPALRAEFERGNYQTSGTASDAIIRVNLKQSREKAIHALFELQPEAVDASLIELLFSKPASLDTALLANGVVHRSPKVRAAVVPILASRRALPVDVAERLLEDSEAIVRFEALRTLIDNGREFSDERAKSVLVKPTSAGLGLFSYATPDKVGEAQWDRFQKQKLRSLPDAALEKLRASELIFDLSVRFALDFKHFAKRAEALRADMDNRFKNEFDAAVSDMERRSIDPETVKKVRSIEESTRKSLTRQAGNLLCEKAAPEDLGRIRGLVASDFVGFSDLDVGYLKKHGEWQDIPLLVSLVERRDSSSPMLLADLYDDERLDGIASAMHAIAKGRFSELCGLPMPERLLAKVVDCAAADEVTALNDEAILTVLNSESETVRRVLVLKAINALSKTRLKKLLKRYVEQETLRYYNVIYWLDLGMSLSKSQVVHAVRQARLKRR